jgi:hypothetical protein
MKFLKEKIRGNSMTFDIFYTLYIVLKFNDINKSIDFEYVTEKTAKSKEH